jgi:threonine/homoserine/homoserine lactone efflux protein
MSPSAQRPTLTDFVLGLAFAGMTFLVKAPVAVFSGALSAWLRSRPGVLIWVYRSSGTMLVGLGVRHALERR